ncbi:MAG: peroxidase, partial [Pseudomonadota bacterium]
SARRWPKNEATGERMGPPITMNIGYTFMGLYMMELPTRTLQGMPDDFIDGMKKRAFILGDKPPSSIERPDQPILPGDDDPDWMLNWDPIWRDNRRRPGDERDVHIWISMNAKVEFGSEQVVKFSPESAEDVLTERTNQLFQICEDVTQAYRDKHGGDQRGFIRVLPIDGEGGQTYFQEASAVFDDFTVEADTPWFGTTLKAGTKLRLPTPQEHFGLADGIGDPVFEGQFDDAEMKKKVVGRGKWMDPSRGEQGWEPLATGEFLLGHPDESQELPPAARPPAFSTNGTFMAFRKLHENVQSWRDYFVAEAEKYAKVAGLPEDQAEVTLRSKMVGRWPDGVPLAKAGTWAEWQAVRKSYHLTDEKTFAGWLAQVEYLRSDHASNFKYGDDIQGYNCPNSSHLRRVNTRDYLDPLANPHPELSKVKDVNKDRDTSLNKRRRILRRGLPYGSSTLSDGDDTTEQGVAMMIICANLFRQFEFVQQQWIQYGLDFNSGNNTCPLVGDHAEHNRFTVAADPTSDQKPYVASGMKTFVEPRGGEYFFIPSLTALSMIAEGIVDPT